jgi:hypothetical protein
MPVVFIHVFDTIPMMYQGCGVSLLRLQELSIDAAHGGPGATERICSHGSY